MYEHIQKEEQILFPFISQMDEDSIIAYPPARACFPSVTHPIFMMEQEHESADHIVTELINLINHGEPPSWVCATHAALFAGLREFETDLRQHVHLENDILFPHAIQLEANLKVRSWS
jgi:regulator of cell morphogenesis and NO signaling